MKKMPKLILLFVFAMCVSAAMANSITQKQEFNGFSGGCHNLTFTKFNNTDGELISVKIIFSLTIAGGTLVLDNDGSDAVSGTLEFGYDAYINSADVFLPNSEVVNNVFYSQDFNLAGDDDDEEGYNPSPPDGLRYDGGNKNCRVLEEFGSDFSGYTGDGNYNIAVNLNLATRTICDGAGGSGLIYETVGYPAPAGYVTVIYDYTPVPEPATIALLCVGGAFVIITQTDRKSVWKFKI